MSSSRSTKPRRNLQRTALALVVMLVGAGLAVAGYALAGTTVVTFTSTGPTPSVASVNWGDTVKFMNADTTPYTLALANDTGTETQTVPAGGSYAKVFNGKAGSHGYTITGKKKFSGKVSVKVSGTVSLSAAAPSVVYGGSVTLSGTTSYVTTPVTIQQSQALGTAAWSDLSTIVPAANGSFSLSVSPLVAMRYRAITADQQLSSNGVKVTVEPKIVAKIRPRALAVKRKLVARATISPATAATTAYLTQHTNKGDRWQVVAQAPVNGGVAKLHWAPQRGGTYKLRIEVHGTALSAGFVASASKATRVSVTWQSTFALKAKPAPRAHAGGFQLAPRFLRAHAGRVTLVLKNLDSRPHDIALKGHKVNLKGRVVGKNGISRLSAMLKPGVYTFYSSVNAGPARGTLRVSR